MQNSGRTAGSPLLMMTRGTPRRLSSQGHGLRFQLCCLQAGRVDTLGKGAKGRCLEQHRQRQAHVPLLPNAGDHPNSLQGMAP